VGQFGSTPKLILVIHFSLLFKKTRRYLFSKIIKKFTFYFVWDIENKLIEVRKPGMIAQYTYDALGRRMGKEVNGVTKQFRYDGEDLIMEMNSNDSITASYTFGPGIDNPLMMNRNDKNYYYVKDGLGSVTALTDSTSNIVKEYKYSVFGKIVEETGNNTLYNPFTYTAREFDKESGLYYYRYRYYNAEIGRFLSEDPIGINSGDANCYRYVWNNSTNFIDPYGMVGEKQILAALNEKFSDAELSPTEKAKVAKFSSNQIQWFELKTLLFALAGDEKTMKMLDERISKAVIDSKNKELIDLLNKMRKLEEEKNKKIKPDSCKVK